MYDDSHFESLLLDDEFDDDNQIYIDCPNTRQIQYSSAILENEADFNAHKKGDYNIHAKIKNHQRLSSALPEYSSRNTSLKTSQRKDKNIPLFNVDVSEIQFSNHLQNCDNPCDNRIVQTTYIRGSKSSTSLSEYDDDGKIYSSPTAPKGSYEKQVFSEVSYISYLRIFS
jgi:hypothetical protein